MQRVFAPAVFLILMFMATGANAVPTLDLRGGDCHDQASCVFRIDTNGPGSIQATLSQPETAFGADDFFGYASGLILGTGIFPHAFSLTLDQTVNLTGFEFDLVHDFGGLTLSGPGLDQATSLTPSTAGLFALAAPVTLLADERYEIATQQAALFTFATISSLSFSMNTASASPAAIPLPPAVLSFLAALLGLGLMAQRVPARNRSDHRHRRTDHRIPRYD